MVTIVNKRGSISIASEVFNLVAGDAATRCFGVNGMVGKAKETGIHAALAFVIQMNGIHRVLPNDDTQPAFGKALELAAKAGVQVVSYGCRVEADSIRITERQGN